LKQSFTSGIILRYDGNSRYLIRGATDNVEKEIVKSPLTFLMQDHYPSQDLFSFLGPVPSSSTTALSTAATIQQVEQMPLNPNPNSQAPQPPIATPAAATEVPEPAIRKQLPVEYVIVTVLILLYVFIDLLM